VRTVRQPAIKIKFSYVLPPAYLQMHERKLRQRDGWDKERSH
jgi:hypothetical protein